LEGGDGVSNNENDETVLKMVACISVTRKWGCMILPLGLFTSSLNSCI
jgi:hypothetical protein